jgi:hypothetical protein
MKYITSKEALEILELNFSSQLSFYGLKQIKDDRKFLGYDFDEVMKVKEDLKLRRSSKNMNFVWSVRINKDDYDMIQSYLKKKKMKLSQYLVSRVKKEEDFHEK